MYRALLLLASIAAPVSAQPSLAPAPIFAQPIPAPPPATQIAPGPWNPVAAYVTVGQDEPGYRSWYLAAPAHRIGVTSFNNYLTTWGVGGVVPTWQLLRTATSWARCGAQPYEVPPIAEWPNIVQTLRYIRDYVVPAVGPVEPVSTYRNPALNACAGGAPESAHKHYSAVDLVPLRPAAREDLMRTLCGVHARRGPDYGVGLGFYAFLRFHIDTSKYRRWGADPGSTECPPIIRPEDAGSVFQPPAPLPAPTATPLAPTMPPVAVDDLAPMSAPTGSNLRQP